MKVNWTPSAKKSFEQILDWLYNNWTNKEIENFLDQTDSTIEQIKNNPYLYRASEQNEQVRRGLVNRFISLYYRVRSKEEEIDLLTFWDNRQNPDSNKYE